MEMRIESAEEFVEEFLAYRFLHPQKACGRTETLVMPKRKGSRRKCTAGPEELRRMYLDDGMTARQIAERFGMAVSSIRGLMRRYGIRKEIESERKES